METTKKSRGGARKGAGRKRLGTDARVTLSCRVMQVTKDIIFAEAEKRGISVGAILDQLVQSL